MTTPLSLRAEFAVRRAQTIAELSVISPTFTPVACFAEGCASTTSAALTIGSASAVRAEAARKRRRLTASDESSRISAIERRQQRLARRRQMLVDGVQHDADAQCSRP